MRAHSSLLLPHLRRLRWWGHSRGIQTGLRQSTPAATKDRPARKGDAIFLTPDMFAQQNDSYFKRNGFFERSIANRVEEFANLIEVWSASEIRDAKDDVQPSSRGIYSFQIVHAHGRFWIASLLFDHERPGVTLPARCLKKAGL
jgi:hypothetical protein